MKTTNFNSPRVRKRGQNVGCSSRNRENLLHSLYPPSLLNAFGFSGSRRDEVARRFGDVQETITAQMSNTPRCDEGGKQIICVQTNYWQIAFNIFGPDSNQGQNKLRIVSALNEPQIR